MKRLIFAAAMVWASVAGAQVTLTGDVRNAAGQTVQLTPQGLFVQSCNAGAGGIVGQDACVLPTDGGGGGGGGGAVTGAAGAFVDGWSATDGLTTDVICPTDTGTCTEVQLFKRLNVSLSTLAAAVGDSLPAGTAIVGKFGIDQTTPGTTNGVSVTNSSIAVTGTFFQATQPVSAADGSNVTLGAKADAKSTATDTTPITVMQVLKEISAMEQAPASRAVTNAGTFVVQSTLAAGTADVGNFGVAQASTTSGQKGPLVQCAVTTSAPTYTTAQSNPLSCGTDGSLRISAPAAAPVNVTVTTPPNDVLTGPTSLTGAGDVTVNSQGSGAAAVQVTGTFTGLSGLIRGSVDGTNYVNIGAYNANTGAVVTAGTAITATGVYVIPAAGYRDVQYHVTAVATGTAVVNLNSSAGALDPPSSVSASGKNVSVTNLPATVDTNAGAAGASTLRMVLATGGASQAVTNAGTFATQSAATLQTQTDTVMVGGVNVKEINAVTPLMGNGTTGTGSQRVTIASDNTAFGTKMIDTGGSTAATVKVASTQAATTDTSLVVSENPLPNTVCTSSVAINQTASTDLVTSVAKLHICSIVIISATAQNISLTEGTGTVCATGAAALIGGTTASVALAANGGFSSVSDRAWLKSKTTADHVCLLQSGAGNVSGVITYADAS